MAATTRRFSLDRKSSQPDHRYVSGWIPQGCKASSCCGGAVGAGFVFVIVGVVAQAAVEDADEAVAQGA